MTIHGRILLFAFLLCPQTPLRSQVTQWESMDGPFVPEKRVHLRYPDGDRRFIGSNTGTYRTTDGGTNWVNICPAPVPNFTVYPSGTGALIGVGDTATFSTDKRDIVAKAIYVSADRGEHWTQTRWARIQAFANAFGGGDTLYQTSGYAYGNVGGAPYVLRSTNGGHSWEGFLTCIAPRGFVDVYTQPNHVFVHLWGDDSFGAQVKSTSDGGNTWQVIDADIVMFYPPDNLLRQRRIWNGSMFSTSAFIERSTDAGASWTTTLTADSGFTSLATNGLGMFFVLRKPGYEMLRSTNAGVTWTSLMSNEAGDPLTSVVFFGRTFIVGTTRSGSYHRSTDYGASWMPIVDMNGAPVRGSLEPASDSLFVVADERGGWLESTDAGGTWLSSRFSFERTKVTSLVAVSSGSLFAGSITGVSRKRGEEPWISVDGVNGPVWAIDYRGGALYHAATGKCGLSPQIFQGMIYGLDTAITPSGNRWSTRAVNQWDFSYRGYEFRSVFPLAEGRALAGSNYYIVQVERGSESVGTHLTTAGAFSAFVEDSSGTLWAANDSTGVFKSTDLGTSWAPADSGLASLTILSMTVARNGCLLAGTRGSGVFRSTDGGASWAASGLPGQNVQSLASGATSRIYAGVDNGVRLSTNSGDTWIDHSKGLSNPDVRAITVAPDGKVYCGTWGDGVYRMTDIELSVPHPSMPTYFSLAQNYPNPFNPTTVVSYQLPVVSNVKLIVYDILGRQVSELVNERREAGVHQVRFDASGLSSGVYFYRLQSGSFVQTRKLLLLR